jgi:L-seryl-tRNA(Ser) seleniumtransferase
VPGAEADYHVPEVANHVPTLTITWDQSRIPLAPEDAKRRLREGHPSIETGGGSDGLSLSTWMMRPGEERVVARRIREILTEASS